MGADSIITYTGITLDGVYRQGNDLKVYCTNMLESEIPDWHKDVVRFIEEWLNDEEYVEAKTSGSTGIPKVIKLSKSSMINSAQKTNAFFQLNNKSKALLCLSANYIAGKMMLVRAFVGGFNLILSEPSGNPLLNICEPIDFVAMVPMQVSNSISLFKNSSFIKNVIVGGGAMSAELKQQVASVNTTFYETYGMTETVSHVAIRKCGEVFFRAMEKVLFEQDERGCLIIKAPDLVACQLITNDIVHLKSQTEFSWLGRYDNVINSGGVKLMPESIEEKIGAFFQFEFYLSSISDEKLGEKLVMVVKESEQVADIPAQLKNIPGLNRFELPKAIIYINEFPMTGNGKINRPALKKIIQY